MMRRHFRRVAHLTGHLPLNPLSQVTDVHFSLGKLLPQLEHNQVTSSRVVETFKELQLITTVLYILIYYKTRFTCILK